jgi:hypothetical protein
MSGTLESYVNRPVSVITADGRNFIGKAATVTAANCSSTGFHLQRLVLCGIATAAASVSDPVIESGSSIFGLNTYPDSGFYDQKSGKIYS